MKIALLSFHNAINFGAALQAYALEKALRLKGYDCEYINYQNKSRKNAYNMTHHIIVNFKKGKMKDAFKYLLGAPFLFLRKCRFKKFYRNFLHCTEKVYDSSSAARSLNNSYEKFIVGSDQVWNYRNNGNDFAFLLNFVEDDNKKISYSSSFGIADIPEKLIPEYKENLLRIKHLSVREMFGVNIIRELTGRDAKLVLDPVFLISKERWLELISDRKIKRDKPQYIFSYTNRKNQLENFVRQTGYSLTGLRNYKLSRHLTPADFFSKTVKQKYTMSPQDFIEVIDQAKLIVSASFHCIALSIILNKPFIAVLTGDRGKDERITSLLEILQLTNRIFDEKMTLVNVNENIDFEKVNKIINEYRSSSYSFLEKSIND